MLASKAFRLCIHQEDCKQLLDSSKWPAYVRLSQWYFKPNQRQPQRVSTPTRSSFIGQQVNINGITSEVVQSSADGDIIRDVVDNTRDNDFMDATDSTVIVADLSNVNVINVS